MPAPAFQIDRRIASRLQQLRRAIRRYAVLQSLALAGLWCLSLYWLFGLIDYLPVWLGLPELPVGVRAAMRFVLIAGAVGWLLMLGLRRLVVPWSQSSLALLFERRFPDLQSRVITVVEAAARFGKHRPEELPEDRRQRLELIQREAAERIERTDIQALFHWRPVVWQWRLLGAGLGLSLLVGLWQPSWVGLWTQRLFALESTAWPRMTRLRWEGFEVDVPGFAGESPTKRLIVPENGRVALGTGQSATLRAAADLTAPKVPENCSISYRSSSGLRGRASMRRFGRPIDQWQPFILEGPPFDSLDEPLWLVLAGGDVTLPGLQIELVPPPLLTELQLEVRYPEYLLQRRTTFPPSESLVYRVGTRIPEGTQLRVIGLSNKPLSEAEGRLRGEGVADAADRPAEPKIVPLQVAQSRLEWDIGPVRQAVGFDFRLWDSLGLPADRIQQFNLGVQIDQVPVLQFRLDGIGSAITNRAVLPMVGQVEDDHAVRRCWLELASGERSLELPATNAGEGEWSQRLDLRQLSEAGELELPIDAQLSLTVAADDFHDLDDGDRVGRASPVQLLVVTENRLLILLEKRELAMRQRLELIIDELEQMRGLLQRIDNELSDSADAGAAGSASDVDQPLGQLVWLSPQQRGEPTAAAADRDDETQLSEAEPDDLVRRRQTLRVQQSQAQAEKSAGEIGGVAREIAQIHRELENNRVDSPDRRQRLEQQVQRPLERVLAETYPRMSQRLRQLEASALAGSLDRAGSSQAIAASDQVLAALRQVLANMLQIEDYNEVIDMVRGLLEEQESLLDQTRQEQRRRVRDLFE
jgi:hypothetical protein